MAENSRKRKRVWVWVFIALGIVTVATVSVGYYLSLQWKPLLESRLKSLVANSSDGLYHIEYSRIKLNVISQNVTIFDFKLVPSDSVYLELRKLNKAPDNLYSLSVSSVVFKNFKTLDLIKKQKLTIEEVLINNPTLQITNERLPYNELNETKPRTLYQSISNLFKELKIGRAVLRSIDFTFCNKSNKITETATLKNIDVFVSDILVNPSSGTDKSRFYYTRNIEVKLHDYQITTSDSLYNFAIKSFDFSSEKKELSLSNVKFSPRFNSATFFKKVGYAKDRFDLKFGRITLGNIDIYRFIRDQRLFAATMRIDSSQIAVNNNNSYPRRYRDLSGKFPHQQLQKAGIDLKIDTLKIANAGISYAEYDKTSRKTGSLTFDRIRGNILNVTNDSTALKNNHYSQANISALFMNSGPVKMKFLFDLTDKFGKFSFQGKLGKFNGKLLNDFTVPLGMVEIQSAKIDSMSFNVDANQNLAKGNLKFYYNDLKVHVLKREENGKLKNQGWISSLANMFIIENQNPTAEGKFTPGVVRFERPSTMSFYTFLWQSLFTGIKESVGLSNEREAELRGTAERIGGFFERMKEKRLENLPEREKKKELRKKRRIRRRDD